MKTRYWLMLLVVSALVLSACAPAVAPQAAAPEAQADGVVIEELGPYLAYPETEGKIVFSNCWGGSRKELIDAWITEFNKYYPNIEVTSDLQESAKIFPTQMTQISGGAAPDVMMITSQNFGMMNQANALASLNDKLERDQVDPNWFYEGEWAARTVDGKVLGIPNVTAGGKHMIFFNKDLLAQIGGEDAPLATWQDLLALTEPAKAAGLYVMDPSKASTNETIFGLLLYANGGRFWDDEYKQILWNSPEGYAAAEWLLEFIKAQAPSYDQVIAGADPWNVLVPKEWAVGTHILMLNGSWEPFMLANEAPQINYGIVPFPSNADNPDSKGATPIEGGWAFAIAETSPNQDAAWEWVKFTTASKYACEFVIAQNRPSPKIDCNDDERFSAGTEYWNVIQESLDNAIPVAIPPFYPELQQMLKDMTEAIIYEKMSPTEALDTYAARAQERLDQFHATGN